MKPLSFFTALFVCLALLLASLYTVAIDRVPTRASRRG